MSEAAAIALSKGLIIFTMLGTAVGEGIVAAAYMKAVGRNPKLEDSLFGKMVIAIALCESTAIYALVAFFLMG